MRWLLLILLCTPLCAQSFDEDKSRFLSAPHGRTGTWAPYRAALTGLDGIDTVTVRSVAPGVVLEKQVAVAGVSDAEVVLPVYVYEGVQLEVGGAIMQPELPTRRVDPDYERAYTAVFSTDPVYARSVLPSTPTGAICDYFALDEFFTDWRLFDGYDAVVIFNPTDVRLPAGSQRAIAEFCSLGGALVVAGSFRFGEQAVDVPAPAEPTLPSFRGVQALRFGYGAGAIYRFDFDELRESPSAHLVLGDALHDHMWFGANRAPAGKPESRVPPSRTPHPVPLPLESALPGPLFWGLAGGLLMLCVLLPVIAARFTKRHWVAQAGLLAGCVGIAGGALLQSTPQPPLEVMALIRSGEGQPASVRLFVQVEETWGDTITLSLDDAATRDLPRSTGVAIGWNAWVIDRPLVGPGSDRVEPNILAGGRVGELIFRDFGTKAKRGDTEFSTGEADVLDWWLDENAFRGRQVEFAPAEISGDIYLSEGAKARFRGAIRVTPVRK